MNLNRFFRFSATTLVAGMLVACSTSNVNPDTGLTDDPQWPEVSQSDIDSGRVGRVVPRESLATLRGGMTKDNLYYILGTPDYVGAWRSTDWNYVLRFKKDDNLENDTVCILKVTYQSPRFEPKIARGFYWKPLSPANAVCPPELDFKGLAYKANTQTSHQKHL
ncbi:outer membrane protein assembly factor BamE [Basilea psittacipulmonis]|uniref:outer membrane protein assembly factor BamE n=1 Tax=Basilea psittacipulmonis TaxID=1472345 RepID=UPI00130D4FFA|nr:outer membrane protein assembly factor BamE [Basilea psittacipulmonis]